MTFAPARLHALPYVPGLMARPEVQGIALCGSHRQGSDDAFSDLDLWVFVEDSVPLSEAYVLERMLPSTARQEMLFEGRDDTLTPHLVINLLTEDGVVNIKALHAGVLSRFAEEARPGLDPQFLEDLENYATMEVLHDPHGILSEHRTDLRERFVHTTGTWLVPALTARYASLYWRSVYQGFLREESASWHHLMGQMIELLAQLEAACDGRLPPPAKWLLSENAGARAQVVRTLSHVQAEIRSVNCTEKSSVVRVYHSLARVESDVLAPATPPHGMWWRKVFTERLPNLALLPDHYDLRPRVQAAAALFRDLV
ncbi:hypothetical protein ACH4K7_33135 [Streptomyces globisporus]|uniref:hypothetical protein n=1 Tax=Streptomyces globisporus TaxID=1908 RepID=UPI0037BC3739